MFTDPENYNQRDTQRESEKEFFPFEESTNNKNITPVKISALQSDAYMAASDFESAEEIRRVLLDEKKNLENLSAEDESLMQILFVNSAVYALNIGDDEEASDMLLYSVDRWPTFSPAIILYFFDK